MVDRQRFCSWCVGVGRRRVVPEPTGRGWLIIVWLAVVHTAVAFTLVEPLVASRLTAIESAAINNTMLIQIAALAWIFLDEPNPAPEASSE